MSEVSVDKATALALHAEYRDLMRRMREATGLPDNQAAYKAVARVWRNTRVQQDATSDPFASTEGWSTVSKSEPQVGTKSSVRPLRGGLPTLGRRR